MLVGTWRTVKRAGLSESEIRAIFISMNEIITMPGVREAVLSFWYGGLDASDTESMQPFWFKSTPELDADIRERFLEIYSVVKSGRLDGDVESADDYLATIIVLDQFPRNMFRGTADAFATDPLARKWATQAVADGIDQLLPAPNRRMFIYLPFEHTEDMGGQNESVRLFEKMGFDGLTTYAYAHRDVIAAYGRFPHRNKALGRVSTPEEEQYLNQPGAGF